MKKIKQDEITSFLLLCTQLGPPRMVYYIGAICNDFANRPEATEAEKETFALMSQECGFCAEKMEKHLQDGEMKHEIEMIENKKITLN